MCFFNSMSKKAMALAARYGRKTDIIEIYQDIINERYNIPAFIHPDYPIVTKDEHIRIMQWGLIPFWIRPKNDDEIQIKETVAKANEYWKRTINARSETVFDRVCYRYPVRSKRCLIPSTGYFEYHYLPDKRTQPYYIHLKDQELFSMAGIYDDWYDPSTGQVLQTFSQLTVPANDLTGWVHNGGKNPGRMPVILRQNDEERWLDDRLSEDDIKLLMYQYPSDKMAAYPVSKQFRDYDFHDPKIIEPVPELV